MHCWPLCYQMLHVFHEVAANPNVRLGRAAGPAVNNAAPSGAAEIWSRACVEAAFTPCLKADVIPASADVDASLPSHSVSAMGAPSPHNVVALTDKDGLTMTFRVHGHTNVQLRFSGEFQPLNPLPTDSHVWRTAAVKNGVPAAVVEAILRDNVAEPCQWLVQHRSSHAAILASASPRPFVHHTATASGAHGVANTAGPPVQAVLPRTRDVAVHLHGLGMQHVNAKAVTTLVQGVKSFRLFAAPPTTGSASAVDANTHLYELVEPIVASLKQSGKPKDLDTLASSSFRMAVTSTHVVYEYLYLHHPGVLRHAAPLRVPCFKLSLFPYRRLLRAGVWSPQPLATPFSPAMLHVWSISGHC